MMDFREIRVQQIPRGGVCGSAYQTACLKYYYPVEFMAALMTSVIEIPSKVAEYIYTCRQMGIRILPPDINKGEGSFSVDNGNIRYGLAAIKSIGRRLSGDCKERDAYGTFRNLEDFITRHAAKDVLNKRALRTLSKQALWTGWRNKKAVYEHLCPDCRSCKSGEKIFHGRTDEPF